MNLPCREFLPPLDRVVAGLAQWLPVASIPEQRRVASVRLDMINHGRGRRVRAITTDRILAQEFFTRLLPLVTVPALR